MGALIAMVLKRPIQYLSLVVVCAVEVRAELLATFETSRGNIVASLQYQTAPDAVANFIGLAEGTRAWIDEEAGGVVRKSRYYDGSVIHRVVNDANFKFAQAGSRNATSTDSPGYTFKDEFSTEQLHTPYVLSMANSGPHTNRAQFFFTGSLPQPSFDFVHTIFGRVIDPASRNLVDQMIAAGPGETLIHRITFQRTDPVAQAFDEHARALPVCSGSKGSLHVKRGVESVWKLDQPQPPGTLIGAFGSTDLRSWTPILRYYQGAEGQGFSGFRFDNASRPKAFYQIPLVTYPNHLSPTSLSMRNLLVTWDNGANGLYVEFDGTGSGGAAVLWSAPGLVIPVLDVTYEPEGYSAVITIVTQHLPVLRIRAGFDFREDGFLVGSHRLEQRIGSILTGFSWAIVGSGGLELSPPR